MEILALSDTDVRLGLRPGAAVEANRRAFLSLARGLAQVPERLVTSVLPYPGSFLVKPCAMLDESEGLGLKVRERHVLAMTFTHIFGQSRVFE
jgi:hypothetical protein